MVVEMSCTWAVALNRSPYRVKLCHYVGSAFLCLICLTYIFIALVCYDDCIESGEQIEGSGVFRLDSIVLCLFWVLLSAGFHRAAYSFGSSLSDVESIVASTLRRVDFLAVVCTWVFGLRFALWTWGTYVYNFLGYCGKIPCQDQSWQITFNNIFYPTFYYTVPEVVASLTLVMVLSPYRREQSSTEPAAAPMSDVDVMRKSMSMSRSNFIHSGMMEEAFISGASRSANFDYLQYLRCLIRVDFHQFLMYSTRSMAQPNTRDVSRSRESYDVSFSN
jgi:hypothetical protein